MKLTYETLLPALYRLHPPAKVRDVTFTFSGRPSISWQATYLKWTVQTFEDKLRYLRSRYKYEETRVGWTFAPRCCIAYVTHTGRVMFRKSEWYRKLPADLLYLQELTGMCKLEVTIPLLWLREAELPALVGYLREIGVTPADIHAAKVDRMVAATPVEKAIRINHSITRRSWLRYYYVTGELTREQYVAHRRRLASDLKTGRFVIRGLDGYYRR